MQNPQSIIQAIKRFALSCIALCTLCLVFVACGGATPTQNRAQSATLVALWPTPPQTPSDTIHLGRVKEGEIVEGQFIVHNISQSPLVIIDVKVACGCAKASFDTKPVMPNEKRNINFTFNSSGRQGAQIKYFELQSADNQNIKIFFDAQVI